MSEYQSYAPNAGSSDDLASSFNPILGTSEGEMRRQLFRKEEREAFNESVKSSASRSRSKNKLEKLRQAKI